MRIHVSFIDRVGITQEVLALLGARNLNLDAVEMVPPNVYIDAPTLSPAVLEELHDALLEVHGASPCRVASPCSIKVMSPMRSTCCVGAGWGHGAGTQKATPVASDRSRQASAWAKSG